MHVNYSRNLKKPNNRNPNFCLWFSNFSLYVTKTEPNTYSQFMTLNLKLSLYKWITHVRLKILAMHMHFSPNFTNPTIETQTSASGSQISHSTLQKLNPTLTPNSCLIENKNSKNRNPNFLPLVLNYTFYIPKLHTPGSKINLLHMNYSTLEY